MPLPLPVFTPRVLIVDDYFISRQVVANVMRELEISDMQVETDGEAGWNAIEQAHKVGRPFDIVFLDWNMPLIEGIDILKHFRGRREFDTTAFVMITAASEQHEVMEAIKAGATAYITKPVSTKTVAKKIREVLDWRQKKLMELRAQKKQNSL